MKWRWPSWTKYVVSSMNDQQYSSEEVLELKIITRFYREHIDVKENEWFKFNPENSIPLKSADAVNFQIMPLFSNLMGNNQISKGIRVILLNIYHFQKDYITNSYNVKYFNAPIMLFLEELKEGLLELTKAPVNQSLLEKITQRLSFLQAMSIVPELDSNWKLLTLGIISELSKIKDNIHATLFSQSAMEKFNSLKRNSENALEVTRLFLDLIFTSKEELHLKQTFSKEENPCQEDQVFQPIIKNYCELYSKINYYVDLIQKYVYMVEQVETIANYGGNILVYSILTEQVKELMQQYRQALDTTIYLLLEAEKHSNDTYKKYLSNELNFSNSRQWVERYSLAYSSKKLPSFMFDKIKTEVGVILQDLSQEVYLNQRYWEEARTVIADFKHNAERLSLEFKSTLQIDYPPNMLLEWLGEYPTTSEHLNLSIPTNNTLYLKNNSIPVINETKKVSSDGSRLTGIIFYLSPAPIITWLAKAGIKIIFIPLTLGTITIFSLKSYALGFKFFQDAKCYTEEERNLRIIILTKYNNGFENKRLSLPFHWFKNEKQEEGAFYSVCFYHDDLAAETDLNAKNTGINIVKPGQKLQKKISDMQIEMFKQYSLKLNHPFIIFLQEIKLWAEEMASVTQYDERILANIKWRLFYIDQVKNELHRIMSPASTKLALFLNEVDGVIEEIKIQVQNKINEKTLVDYMIGFSTNLEELNDFLMDVLHYGLAVSLRGNNFHSEGDKPINDVEEKILFKKSGKDLADNTALTVYKPHDFSEYLEQNGNQISIKKQLQLEFESSNLFQPFEIVKELDKLGNHVNDYLFLHVSRFYVKKAKELTSSIEALSKIIGDVSILESDLKNNLQKFIIEMKEFIKPQQEKLKEFLQLIDRIFSKIIEKESGCRFYSWCLTPQEENIKQNYLKLRGHYDQSLKIKAEEINRKISDKLNNIENYIQRFNVHHYIDSHSSLAPDRKMMITGFLDKIKSLAPDASKQALVCQDEKCTPMTTKLIDSGEKHQRSQNQGGSAWPLPGANAAFIRDNVEVSSAHHQKPWHIVSLFDLLRTSIKLTQTIFSQWQPSETFTHEEYFTAEPTRTKKIIDYSLSSAKITYIYTQDSLTYVQQDWNVPTVFEQTFDEIIANGQNNIIYPQAASVIHLHQSFGKNVVLLNHSSEVYLGNGQDNIGVSQTAGTIIIHQFDHQDTLHLLGETKIIGQSGIALCRDSGKDAIVNLHKTQITLLNQKCGNLKSSQIHINDANEFMQILSETMTYSLPLSFYLIAGLLAFRTELTHTLKTKLLPLPLKQQVDDIQNSTESQVVMTAVEMGIRHSAPTQLTTTHDVVHAVKQTVQTPTIKVAAWSFFSATSNIISHYAGVPLLGLAITGTVAAITAAKEGYKRNGLWGALDKGIDGIAYVIPGGDLIMKNLELQEKAYHHMKK